MENKENLKENIGKVYVVDNGDIILEHNLMFEKGVNDDTVKEMKEIALNMVEDGEVTEATFNDEEVASYYDKEGEFLGHPGMHIFEDYKEHCELFFVKKVSDTKKEEEFFNKAVNTVKEFNRKNILV